MTSLLPTLFVLLTEATLQPVTGQPAQERTIEIVITGPESARARMEEAIRALVGDSPDIHWTTRESPQGDGPLPAAKPAGGERILVDLDHPVEVRVYLPSCASSGARTVRIVERAEGEEAGLVERETVAQIVKATLQSLRGDAASAAPTCAVASEHPQSAPVADPPRRRARAVWVGMGSGVGWGYVPKGQLEWEKHIEVAARAEMAGLFHLLPEVGFMWTDHFALAAQFRMEFIRQEQSSYIDPNTNEIVRPADYVNGTPKSKAYAGLLRAIWYRDLSASGKLRLSLSGDVGGGVVRFPVRPVAAVNYEPMTDTYVVDFQRTIATTDTRPLGVFLFGGSVGLLWHLSRHFALACDGRVLSGLPAPGIVFEGQVSGQLAFGGARPPVAAALRE
jgi:hypothetical protein